MLIYLDDDQAKTLADILESTTRQEEVADWADFVPNPELERLDRIERPDLVAASESRVKLCKDLIKKLEVMIQ